MIAAELHGVSKRFGRTVALDSVDLALQTGEAVAMLGPNGAGKTTALAVLLGLRRPDCGAVRLFGRDPRDVDARSAVGVTPQESTFPPTLRVGEIVDLVRAHFPGATPAGELLDRFQLTSLQRRQAGGLSGGERRRLSVALAFAGRPRAVFLDEPTANLDVESRLRVWRELAEYSAQGGAILLTTHDLEEAERLATRIVVLHGGRIAAEGTPAELSSRTRTDALEDAFLALTEVEP